MKVSIFGAFGCKTPIHAQKVGILGDFDPLMGSSISETPKRNILERVHVV